MKRLHIMGQKEIKVTQADIDELRAKMVRDLNNAISHLVSMADHRERCGKYKLKFKINDNVEICKRKLIAMGYPLDVEKISGKIREIERHDSAYPPYIACIATNSGMRTFGIGWLRKVRSKKKKKEVSSRP